MPLSPPTITKIVIDWDEDACQALIEYEGDGYMHSAVITDPEAFYDAVKAGIGPWLRERDEARRTAPVASEGAYELSDPKHPDFHSIHSNIWDARDGK